MYTPYMDMLSAKAFIKILASQVPEEYCSAEDQLDDLIKAARSWVSANLHSPAYDGNV